MIKEQDEEREERISMDIVVDCYDSEERAMGWYSYLGDTLDFPFTATCMAVRSLSPLEIGETVEVVDMAADEECEREMFVKTTWGKRNLAVPLAQLKPIAKTDAKTVEAVEDWHYWVAQGYRF